MDPIVENTEEKKYLHMLFRGGIFDIIQGK